MMHLYHGTSEPAARRILAEGIKPRGNRKGNWKIRSSRERVYLTDCYAAAFAQHAARGGKGWALVEVDISRLDTTLLLPDEDFLEQVGRRFDRVPGEMEERTAHYRKEAGCFCSEWKECLRSLGTVAYAGVVPLAAISRVAIFTPTNRDSLYLQHLDVTISPLVHEFAAKTHRAVTAWFFGEKVTCSEFSGFTDELIDDLYPKYRVALTEWLARRERVEVLDLRRSEGGHDQRSRCAPE